MIKLLLKSKRRWEEEVDTWEAVEVEAEDVEDTGVAGEEEEWVMVEAGPTLEEVIMREEVVVVEVMISLKLSQFLATRWGW